MKIKHKNKNLLIALLLMIQLFAVGGYSQTEEEMLNKKSTLIISSVCDSSLRSSSVKFSEPPKPIVQTKLGIIFTAASLPIAAIGFYSLYRLYGPPEQYPQFWEGYITAAEFSGAIAIPAFCVGTGFLLNASCKWHRYNKWKRGTNEGIEISLTIAISNNK